MMSMWNNFLGLALCFLTLFASTILAVKDNMKNRRGLVDKYYELNPIEDAIENMARVQMSQMAIAEERELFRRSLENLDIEKVDKIIRHTMVKHFNANELEFLVEVYSNPIGKTVMTKMGGYATEISPKLHEAMLEAVSHNVEYMEKYAHKYFEQYGIDPKTFKKTNRPAIMDPDRKLPPRSAKVPDGVKYGDPTMKMRPTKKVPPLTD